jgi:hypothetical protein
MRKDVKAIALKSPHHAGIVESVQILEGYLKEVQQYIAEGSWNAAESISDCIGMRGVSLAKQIATLQAKS